MGGVDKGWVDVSGRFLVERLVERLSPQVGEVVINANRELDRYRELGLPVISDDVHGFPGPLAGAAAAMRAVRTPWTLLAPIDMPWLPLDCATTLSAAADGADIVSAHDGERRQPLVALIRTSLREDLQAWLATGEAKVIVWYARHRWREVSFECGGRAFANLNTPEERVMAERQERGDDAAT